MTRNAPRALAIAAAGVIVALTARRVLAVLRAPAVGRRFARSGRVPARAWAWPATLDLFIVAGELLLLRASLTARTDWWAIGLTVTGSGGSIALNISGVGAHAHTLDYVVAAVPPTAALLAFGALMRQVHDALATPAVRTEDAPATVPDSADAGDHDRDVQAGQPATAPADTEPSPALAAPAAEPAPAPRKERVRQAPGAGKTARAVRSDDELLADLRELRTGADWPLSQRAVLAALGIGVPRLRALLDAHGRIPRPAAAARTPAAVSRPRHHRARCRR